MNQKIKNRIPEDELLIADEVVKGFDHQDKSLSFLRLPIIYKCMRDGISQGRILEAGCGPGILGLTLLEKCRSNNISLVGIDGSEGMVEQSRRNAKERNLEMCTEYCAANLVTIPYPDNSFDGIISNGSLHHWVDPIRVFFELVRVLKQSGKIFINDLRRDSHAIPRTLLFPLLSQWQKKHFILSQNASYTVDECKNMLTSASLTGWTITTTIMEFEIRGTLRKI
ncbi:class I SAM-dependent methyltransferase [Candidatus Omnitrophota bacterium]